MSNDKGTSDYELCAECTPTFHTLLADMTSHISKEISLLRLIPGNECHDQLAPRKSQLFSNILLKFFKRIVIDVKEGRQALISSYCQDMAYFLEGKAYESQEQGKWKLIICN